MITTNEDKLSVLITCDSNTSCNKSIHVQVNPDTPLATKIALVLPVYQQGVIDKEQLQSTFEDFREAVRQDFTTKGWYGVSNEETYCHEHKGEVNV